MKGKRRITAFCGLVLLVMSLALVGCGGGGGGGGSYVAPPVEPPPPSRYIEIISPNGGENWEIGKPQNVLWSSENLGDDVVSIELYKNDQFYLSIGEGIENSGKFIWTPESLEPGDFYSISIVDFDMPEIFDLSDGYFSIVAVPLNPPIINSFQADPEKVRLYESTILSWSVDNADECYIRVESQKPAVPVVPDIGFVNSTGSIEIFQEIKNIVYELRATNEDGSVYSSQLIQVYLPIPRLKHASGELDFDIDPKKFNGEWYWDFEHADYFYIYTTTVPYGPHDTGEFETYVGFRPETAFLYGCKEYDWVEIRFYRKPIDDPNFSDLYFQVRATKFDDYLYLQIHGDTKEWYESLLEMLNSGEFVIDQGWRTHRKNPYTDGCGETGNAVLTKTLP